jgi:hypothetical protein
MGSAVFIKILQSDLGQALFKTSEKEGDPGDTNPLNQFTKDWTPEQKACLLHMNGVGAISKDDDGFDDVLKATRNQLLAVAAFSRKDYDELKRLLYVENVSTGVRLDYGLPLHSETYHAGEDVFVCALKLALGGPVDGELVLEEGSLQVSAEEHYSREALDAHQAYVKNAFEIRELLIKAPNKTIVKPNQAAIDFLLAPENLNRYRDSNENPVIVFIPGLIDTEEHVSSLIQKALSQGAKINDTGYLGVTGLVWSAILADLKSVQVFLRQGVDLGLVDHLGDTALDWAKATLNAGAAYHGKALPDLFVTNAKSARRLLQERVSFVSRQARKMHTVSNGTESPVSAVRSFLFPGASPTGGASTPSSTPVSSGAERTPPPASSDTLSFAAAVLASGNMSPEGAGAEDSSPPAP